VYLALMSVMRPSKLSTRMLSPMRTPHATMS
jgi:hypothetical protein